MKRSKKAIIQTERLVLKPYTDEDCEAMVSMLCNEKIKKTFMIPDFATREDAVRMFHKLKDWSESDEHFEYGVYLQGLLIGFVNDVEIDRDSIEVGYVIHPAMQNQGYATEMLAAVITELFRIGYTTVRAGFFEENTASRRVMEKCGMVKTEHEEDIEYQGKIHHCIYYEKTGSV